jgi:phage-related protein
MSLQTFTPPSAPDVSSSGSHKFRTLKAQFGDAYSQRAADGINPLESDYNFTWTKGTVANFNSMKAFMDARGGYQAFNYTIPGAASPSKFICEQYGEIWEEGALKGFSATLKRVYDL